MGNGIQHYLDLIFYFICNYPISIIIKLIKFVANNHEYFSDSFLIPTNINVRKINNNQLNPIFNPMSFLDQAKVQYALDDISIIPAVISPIRSRKECDPFYDYKKLPIFTAPMASVVSPTNFYQWPKNGITPIMPRNVDIQTRCSYTHNGHWCAYSVSEFKDYFIDHPSSVVPYEDNVTTKVLIDIANGHMQILVDYIKEAKEVFKQLDKEIEIMVGNIANPKTYQVFAEAGADYVRCSIGSGQVCLTSVNTPVHYGMASLIAECFDIKEQNHYHTKIIADGGILTYRRANVALALGADYVMIGTAFAKCYESAGKKTFKESNEYFREEDMYGITLNRTLITQLTNVNQYICLAWREDGKLLLSTDDEYKNVKIFTPNEQQKKILLKEFKGNWVSDHFGMSTKKAQKLINGTDAKLKTSEGVETTVTIDYTLAGWAENFVDYLRSTMSYCGKRTLEEFIGNVEVGILSPCEQFAVNK